MAFWEWLVLVAICLGSALAGAAVLCHARTGRHTTPPDGRPANALLAQESAILERAPIAIWVLDRAGQVAWHNAAFTVMERLVRGESGPRDTPVFPLAAEDGPDRDCVRIALYAPGGAGPEWYEITRIRQGDRTLCYARNVSDLMEVERSKTDFFQTLAGTFAHLSIGLAIFDRDGRLHLFNPALVELCGLPFSFLSSRPDLASFFDRLRDAQAMPEPRDYSVWRQDLSDLQRAAAEGRYQETWSLPSGSVYQVTGQPHPGGAIAFLFEDISAEVSLARQFRSELELNETVLNALEDAICVFSAAGKLVLANDTYQRLWNTGSADLLRGLSLDDACDLWSTRSEPACSGSVLMQRLSDGADAPVLFRMPDGQELCPTVRKLPRGDLMIRFRSGFPAASPGLETTEPV